MEHVLRRGRGGMLLLANHPALMDPVIMLGFVYPRFRYRALGDQDQVARPGVNFMAERFGVIQLPDATRHGPEALAGVNEALAECGRCIARGENVLLYPAGHILRSFREDIGGNSGVETVLRHAPDARVVLLKTSGLWGSMFSRADGGYPEIRQLIRKVLRTVLLNGIFFIPRRSVLVECVEPQDLPVRRTRDELNPYLEAFYNREPSPNTYVPYHFTERGGPRTVPEPDTRNREVDLNQVSSTVRDLVLKKMETLTGHRHAVPEHRLSNDLGMDSLSRLALQIWVESEFGFHVPNPDMFETVADVLAAASGQTLADRAALIPVPPARWFRSAGSHAEDLRLAEGKTLLEVFLNKAAGTPDAVLLADGRGGVRNYRNILTAIRVLKPEFKSIPGDYAGIMLPASPTAGILFLTALAAGKIPVMLNWTVGARNLNHMVKRLELARIFTSEQLIRKIQSHGITLGNAEQRFTFLEPLAASLPLIRKLVAKYHSYGSQRDLLPDAPHDTAVVLFTSGSESFPKAVPLTHRNLLTNLQDILHIDALTENDSIIGFLPPFHSFGLTLTVILPLLTGVRTVYHPNPTESGTLAKLIRIYRATVLAGTPTFIKGILKGAMPGDLDSLRIAVTGAEKCPEQVYRDLEAQCRNLKILEGYGITECSPVVAVNHPKHPVPYSIGKIMDSLEYLILDETRQEPCAPGEQGMLLVRGDSVFPGYLGDDVKSPFVNFRGKSYYRTGDLVVEDEDGVLFFKGRLKRFIKLGGEMVSMPAIEEVLNQHFQTSDDKGPFLAVESPQEDAPELTLFTARDISREQANAAIRQAGLSPLHNIRRVVCVPEIPVLGTGKTDYRTLKQQNAG